MRDDDQVSRLYFSVGKVFSFAMAGEHKIRFCACAGGIGGDSEFAGSDSRGLVEDIVEVVRRIESAGCRDVLDRHFLKGEHLFGLIQSGEHDLLADGSPEMLAEQAAECRVRDADMVCDFLNRQRTREVFPNVSHGLGDLLIRHKQNVRALSVYNTSGRDHWNWCRRGAAIHQFVQ